MNRRELTQIYYNEMLEKFLPQIIHAFRNGTPDEVFELSEVDRFRRNAALENFRVTYNVTQTLIECYVTDRESHYTKTLLIPTDYPIETVKRVSVIQYTGHNESIKGLIREHIKDV